MEVKDLNTYPRMPATSFNQPHICNSDILNDDESISARGLIMTTSAEEVRNRDIVRHVYEASLSGDANAFRAAMHEDFEESVPPILPWGGVHRPDAIFGEVLPKFGAAVDASSIHLVSLSVDGDHVAALLSARSAAGDELWIAEHWIVRDEKVWRMRNFYFDTIPLQK